MDYGSLREELKIIKQLRGESTGLFCFSTGNRLSADRRVYAGIFLRA